MRILISKKLFIGLNTISMFSDPVALSFGANLWCCHGPVVGFQRNGCDVRESGQGQRLFSCPFFVCSFWSRRNILWKNSERYLYLIVRGFLFNVKLLFYLIPTTESLITSLDPSLFHGKLLKSTLSIFKVLMFPFGCAMSSWACSRFPWALSSHTLNMEIKLLNLDSFTAMISSCGTSSP